MKDDIRKMGMLFGLALALGLGTVAASAQIGCDQNLIVGAWRGISGEGNALVLSFITGGNLISSVQSEVTLNPRLSVLTPVHGVWTHLGGCQYGFTGVGLLYTAQKGKYNGYIKAKGIVNLDPTNPNVMTGTDKVTIYDAAGNPVFEVPEGLTTFTRTEMEPFGP